MHLAAGSIVAGKFRLERPLAQGGMGSVWVAFNTQLEVPVALKFMAPALVGSAELVARFEREAKGAAQLRNPHVVQIFEHGVDRGTPFIAMELLEGEDLGARLRATPRLSPKETSRILGDVCKALQGAHKKGLVHRDLKPANIFLAKHDEYEVVKVLDFGIAKSMSQSAEEVTQTGALVGSPHYMAPEQARRTNKQVDHRSDLWSLGVIAFRCVTGRLPFVGETVINVLVEVCTNPAPAPSSIASDLGPEVDRFFAKALARDPDARFQNAKEMSDALMRLAGQEPLPGLDRSWSDVNPSGRPPATDPPKVQLRLPDAGPASPTRFGGAAARVPDAGPASPTRFGGAAARVPEPRASQPSISREADDDGATTVPIQDPKAQRAVEGRPWAAAVRPGSPAVPLSPTLVEAAGGGRPAEVAAAAAQVPPGLGGSPTFAVPPGLGGPSGAPPPLGAPRVDGGRAAVPGFVGVSPSGPPVPSFGPKGPAFGAAVDGTLTSAGTELLAAGPRRDKPWVALAAGAAVVVVISVVGLSVWLGRGEDAASGESASGAITPLWSTTTGGSVAPDPTPAPSQDPAGSASSAPQATAPAGPTAEPTATVGVGPTPTATATAAPGLAKSAKPQDDDAEARRALAGPAKARASATPTTKPPPGPTPGIRENPDF